MIAIKAHFDGTYLVPDEPLDIPRNKPLNVQIDLAAHEEPARDARGIAAFHRELSELAERLPPDPQLPADGAAQHDHYLYGTPKR